MFILSCSVKQIPNWERKKWKHTIFLLQKSNCSSIYKMSNCIHRFILTYPHKLQFKQIKFLIVNKFGYFFCSYSNTLNTWNWLRFYHNFYADHNRIHLIPVFQLLAQFFHGLKNFSLFISIPILFFPSCSSSFRLYEDDNA